MIGQRNVCLLLGFIGHLLVAPCLAEKKDLLRRIEPNQTGGSAAVVVGDVALVHTTQILPLDKEGRLVAKSAKEQAARVLDRLETTLVAAGSGLERVAKLNVYVARHEIADEVQRVVAARFPGTCRPAVALVATRLPGAGVLVAADAVAVSNVKASQVKRLDAVRAAICPRGSRIYISGQAQRSTSLAEATRKTLEGLRATLKSLGRSDADIVQLKAFMLPMTDANIVRREAVALFGRRVPLVLVEWQSGGSVPIEIELVAWGGKDRGKVPVEYLTPPGMKASPVFSRVARIDGRQTIFVSGLFASPTKKENAVNAPATGEREVKEIFARLTSVLKQADSDLRHLVKATYYVSSDAASGKLNQLRPSYYDPQRPPAASKAKVADVGRRGLGLTIDMIAVPAPPRNK